MAPTQQRAVVVTENGATFSLVDIAKPGPRQILIKVAAVAQNPTDCQFTPFGKYRQGTHRICREVTWTGPEGGQVWWDCRY